MDAHCEAGFVVGIPFAAHGLYDFGSHGNMTTRWVGSSLSLGRGALLSVDERARDSWEEGPRKERRA